MIQMMGTKIQWTPEKVLQRAEKGKRKALLRAGALLCGAAQRLIGKRKKLSTHSKPGKPPYTHDGPRHAYLLRESIVFGLSQNGNSVLIGPSGRKVDFIGQLHEFGLKRSTLIRRPEFLRKLKIGGGGPVSSRKYRGQQITGVEYYDPLDGSPVMWAKLKTQKMLAHSKRLQKRLADAYAKKQSIDYPERKFMLPALKQVERKIPALWRKTVSY
jgi:hypothetical protein